MKHQFYYILLTAACSLMVYAEGELTLTPLPGFPESKTEVFFSVKKGETQVNGEVIREFAISKDRVTVAYKNTTAKTLSPKYTIRIYNRYGIMIGSGEVSTGLFGSTPRLEPGDIGGDKLLVEWLESDSIFKHSTISQLPKDFDQATWISIADSNSKVASSVIHPASASESKLEDDKKTATESE